MVKKINIPHRKTENTLVTPRASCFVKNYESGRKKTKNFVADHPMNIPAKIRSSDFFLGEEN